MRRALAILPLLVAQGAFGFEIGDRVEVMRGLEWARGTVTEFDATRNRYTVRLDDDGSLANLPPEQREKRLTRKYFPSDMRVVRGADNPPEEMPPSPGSTPSPAPAGEGGPGAFPKGTFESRTWSDKSGRFKIEAAYGGMNGKKVILEKTDGTKIEVELAKLSEGDKIYVEAMSIAADENPFNVPAGAGDRAPTPRPGRASQAKMKAIQPKNFSSWTFKPTATSPSPAGDLQPQSIQLAQLPTDDFEDVGPISVSADGRRALVKRGRGFGGEPQVYVEEVDLVSGNSVGLAPLPPGFEILALSAEYRLVIWKANAFARDDIQLRVGRIEEGKLVELGGFVPQWPDALSPSAAFNEADDAHFVGPSHVLISRDHGDVMVVWNVEQMTPVWSIQTKRGSDPVFFSPNGRIGAFMLEAGIALVDLLEGQHVATLKLDSSDAFFADNLAISPDLTRLALSTRQDVLVFDLTTGQSLSRFQARAFDSFRNCSWAGDFLLNGPYVFAPRHRVLLWEFEGLEHDHRASTVAGGQLVTLVESRGRRGPRFLSTQPVPTTEMLELAKSLGTPESLLIGRPGDKISIELDIDPAAAKEEEVFSKLVKAVEAAGLEVVVGEAPLVLKGYCRQKPSEAIRIAPENSSREEDIIERTITPHPTYVSISYQGTEVWRRGSSGQPGAVIWLQKDESVDDALQRLTTPNLELFEKLTVKLPLVRQGTATPNGAYGTSNLNSAGGRFE